MRYARRTHAVLVVHGHFYQPPRENPWTEEVDQEPSADPYHDWNARISAECYTANGYARLYDAAGRIDRVLNTYGKISFNFGPTLLRWLERSEPDTYARILAGDRESMSRLGHGNAIAQAYNHMILPLATPRDRRTQIRWGIADFVWRFGRRPEGMWLPDRHRRGDAGRPGGRGPEVHDPGAGPGAARPADARRALA
jgi:alpha-amylase/alpha-mannosidase (GH57 family)